jgi:hypothetical protein
VAAADRFLQSQETTDAPPVVDTSQPSVSADSSSPENEEPTFLKDCLPLLSESERASVVEILQTEYIHMLPLVQLGLASTS